MILSRVVLCGVLVAGCASAGAQRARDRALERQLDAYRHAQPLEQVWQEARRLLAEQGYPLAGRDAAAVGQEPMSWPERITSPARETGAPQRALLQALGVASDRAQVPVVQSLDTGWNRYRERYHVEGRSDDAGCRIVFRRLKEDPTEHRAQGATRDVDLELALVRRVDPAAATRLEEGLRPAAPGAR